MKKKITGKQIWPYLFCAPFVFCFLMFTLYPTAYSLEVSFHDWNGFGDKVFVGAGNYLRIFTRDKLYWKAFLNTAVLMLLSTPTTVFLGLLLSYVLYRLRTAKRFFQTAAFYPYVITPVAIGFIFSYLFDWKTGLMNRLLQTAGLLEEPFNYLQSPAAIRLIIVVMIVWRYLGYYTMLFLAAMTSVSPEIYDAARVDGASSPQTFWKITVPMLRRTIVFLTITSVIGGLKMFEEPMLLFSGWSNAQAGATGGPGNAALTVMWKFYNDAYRLDSRLGYAAAESYVLFLLAMTAALILHRLTRERQI
ncbi:carbohydrate ABC transporter permease [Lachnoclostridium sp. Marseille-P6806]|uniref:carbohydrate ABC transporter permease n=1 Tax=Lachnoclostridium sp. Marseille-P6806 TaxID=2364793 RepID=UPI0010319439|nr:sugar ABC transporter permease [Lachnoclostridium sp. Marseille-P6806]